MLRLSLDQAKIVCPDVDICDVITRHMLVPGAQKDYEAQTRTSAIVSARRLAGKYNCHGVHSAAVAAFATALFDKMKKVHGLSEDKSSFWSLRRFCTAAASTSTCARTRSARSTSSRTSTFSA